MKILIAVLALVACSKGKHEEPAGGAGGGGAPASGPVTLNASGSTFQKAFQEEAIAAFAKSHSDIKINYGAGGSGKGRQDLSDMVTDFAGSDAPFKDDDAAKAKGGAMLYFPVLFGAVTLSYNLDGVDKLQLSPDTIAKIYQRQIKKWNDPEVAKDNPGVKLPAADIVVAHRADGSGTTDIFTRFLDGAAKETWKLKFGSTVEWPADTQAGQGNGGVAQIVKSTKGAIGYVDLSDAKASGLRYASVKNSGGKYVEPTSASASAAGDGIDIKENLTFSATNAKGDAAYPIAGQTWIIVYAKQRDKAKAEALKQYIKFMLTDGQQLLAPLDFAPLPRSLADKALTQLDKIST